ncbi:MAG TPA: phosphoribosyl-ATP diphosphatase [Rickettsiales bacterium]|nr:phosphoribosyl-ATP diphosphatase [Rickettsiales bacterium]
MLTVLNRLYQTISERKGADPQSSYAASLFAKGSKKIAQKVGEEATEVVLAAAGGDQHEIISESADLLFHLSVLWAQHGVTPEDVAAELSAREGTSGIEEKKQRAKP